MSLNPFFGKHERGIAVIWFQSNLKLDVRSQETEKVNVLVFARILLLFIKQSNLFASSGFSLIYV